MEWFFLLNTEEINNAPRNSILIKKNFSGVGIKTIEVFKCNTIDFLIDDYFICLGLNGHQKVFDSSEESIAIAVLEGVIYIGFKS